MGARLETAAVTQAARQELTAVHVGAQQAISQAQSERDAVLNEGRNVLAAAGAELSSARVAAKAAERERDDILKQGRAEVAAATSDAALARGQREEVIIKGRQAVAAASSQANAASLAARALQDERDELLSRQRKLEEDIQRRQDEHLRAQQEQRRQMAILEGELAQARAAASTAEDQHRPRHFNLTESDTPPEQEEASASSSRFANLEASVGPWPRSLNHLPRS